MTDHDTRAEVRSNRFILERIDRDLTGHLRRQWDRDMRNADKEGRRQGRLDRIEATLDNLGTLIKNLDAKLEEQAASADH